MTRRRPWATVGGYSVTGRHGRVYLVDQFPDADLGMMPAEARALAEALIAAARRAEQQVRRLREVSA
jgi:hypothetical protein